MTPRPASSGAVVATPSQTSNNNNNFLTHVNPPNKITIRYPSTWTKTELEGNPNIPVIFSAPISWQSIGFIRSYDMELIRLLS